MRFIQLTFWTRTLEAQRSVFVNIERIVSIYPRRLGDGTVSGTYLDNGNEDDATLVSESIEEVMQLAVAAGATITTNQGRSNAS